MSIEFKDFYRFPLFVCEDLRNKVTGFFRPRIIEECQLPETIQRADLLPPTLSAKPPQFYRVKINGSIRCLPLINLAYTGEGLRLSDKTVNGEELLTGIKQIITNSKGHCVPKNTRHIR